MTGFLALFCSLALSSQLPAPVSPAPAPLAPSPGSGLAPLQPPTASPAGKELRLEPNQNSTSLRQVRTDDQVTYLRSQGAWYEIEVKTVEGLIFRGWIESELAEARRLPTPAPIAARREQPKPMTSQRFVMFWDKRASQRGSLKLSVGPQQSIYSLSGLVASGGRENISPGYNFLGGHFGLEGEFIPLSTDLGRGFTLSPILRGSYAYGLHRVAFGNPFADVPEVSGQAYSIDTNTYQIELTARVTRQITPGIEMGLSLGAGFIYHEVAPDLDPIPGSDELIFVEQSTSGMLLPLELSAQFHSEYSFALTAKPVLFSDFLETPEVTPNPKLSTIPWIFQARAGWQWTPRFALELAVEWLDLKASGDGSATRLGENFDDGQISTSLRKTNLGIRWKF